jgi:2-oxoglutarate dehydrogenase E2 component (dihydrolipoamide succinyltransferase)
MPTNIVVPELGESVVEATVAKWLKKEGDPVAVGEPLVELETEKVDLEVGASHAGVLARIHHPDGSDVKIGDVLGVIEEAAAVVPTPGPSAPAAPPPAEPARARPRATASAKRLAGEHDVDVGAIKGTGESGRVTRQDVEAHVGGASPEPRTPNLKPRTPNLEQNGEPRTPNLEQNREPRTSNLEPRSTGEERVRMSRRRLTIARRLVEAQRTAAMLTTFNELDMTAVQDLRRRHKETFKSRHGVGLGLSGFFVKAAVAALKQTPRLNAEIDGDEMVLKRHYDIGIAVGASEGLVVPVLRDADRMSFAAIESAIKDFAQRAEAGALTLEDLRGGTFTITNGGVFGSLLSTPILNPPQVGILGLHKIEDRAVPRDGQVVIRPMMYVALSYDHRIVDGREAVQFLVFLKELIEDPAVLIFEA